MKNCIRLVSQNVTSKYTAEYIYKCEKDYKHIIGIVSRNH